MVAGIGVAGSTGEAGATTLTASIRLIALARRVPGWARLKLDCAVERQRMNLIRRNPTALTTALKSATNILIVCHGNIIRSVFAARLVAQAVGDRARVSVSSGGLAAVPGSRPHPTALRAATRLGVDLSRHASASVAPEAVASSDVIFVMDIPQLVVMRKRFPRVRHKMFLLTCLAPEGPLEVRDPVNGDESLFEECFDHISRAVRPIVHILTLRRATERPRTDI